VIIRENEQLYSLFRVIKCYLMAMWDLKDRNREDYRIREIEEST